MAFKIVDGKGRATGRGHVAGTSVSFYGKTAQFRLTPDAVTALGEPEKIEVLYDEETNQIGLRASDASHAVALRKDSSKASSRYFGFRSFANMVGLTPDGREVIQLEPSADDATMLVGTLPVAE